MFYCCGNMERNSWIYEPIRIQDENSELTPSEAFDRILNDVNPSGKWQAYICFIASLSGFVIGMQSMVSALITATPSFRCNITGVEEIQDIIFYNNSLSTSEGYVLPKCKYYQYIDPENARSNLTFMMTCESWIYDASIYSSTTVSEWDLVCDNKWLNSVIQSTFMAGVLAGGVILGEVSDAYGRRTVSIFSTVLFIIFSVISVFSLNYYGYLVLRFLTAFFSFGILIPNFVIVMEVLGSSARAKMGVLFQVPFGFGICYLAGIGYFIREWRMVQLAISAPTTILLIYFCYLPESPRWLLSQKRVDEAVEILKRMAKVNGGRLAKEEHLTSFISKMTNKESKNPNILKMILRFFKNQIKLVKTPIIRKRSLIMFFAWFVVSIIFYGLSFSAGNIETSVYLLVFLSGLAEVTGLLTSWWTIGKFGRKINLSGSFILTGTCCLLILAIPKELIWINVTLATIGKYFISAAFAIVYIFSAELIPTEMRNLSVGTCSMYARIGSMVAPFVVDLLGEVHYAIPSTVFGILAIFAGLLVLLLPETDKQKLPETIEEIEKLDR